MHTGLLLLRTVTGGLIFAHGSQKAFGAFGGMGRDGTAPVFDSWGLRPGRRMVTVASANELVGSSLLMLGLATPLGAAMTTGTLSVAASVNAKNGLWAAKGGYELPLLYAVTAGVLGFTGPGRYSVDSALGLTRRYGAASGVGALALAAIPAGTLIRWSRRNRAATEETA